MQELEQRFADELRRNGLRATDNRLVIFRILSGARRPLLIQEIISKGKAKHAFTSVYRSVEQMTEAGILRVVPRGFKNMYELGEAFLPHYHYATCKKCGVSVIIHDEKLEQMMSLAARKVGFLPIKHHFEIVGLCGRCRRKMRRVES
jgi:Fur family ferric uptake transcriptional regulator